MESLSVIFACAADREPSKKNGVGDSLQRWKRMSVAMEDVFFSGANPRAFGQWPILIKVAEARSSLGSVDRL
jgi:hypothetical protein